jgi:hypothetical protein
VVITDVGQARINTAALAAFGTVTLGVAVLVDKEGHKLGLLNLKAFEKGKTADNYFKLSLDKEGKIGYLSGLTPVLREYGYDFKASGSQNFTPTFSQTKSGTLCVLDVPIGSLTPRPKVARASKKQREANHEAVKASEAAKAEGVKVGESDLI